MPKEELESVEKSGEQPIEPSTKEAKKEVSQVTKTPSLRETEEFQQALKESQSGWDRRLQAQESEAKAEAKRLGGLIESYKQEIDLLDKANLGYLGENPDAIEAYADKKKIARDRIIATRERAEAERILAEARKEQQYATLAKQAREISKQTGISFEELQDCETITEMRFKGKEFQLDKRLSELESKKTETEQTFKPDTGVSTGGPSLSFQKIEKAYAEGKIAYAEYAEARKREKI